MGRIYLRFIDNMLTKYRKIEENNSYHSKQAVAKTTKGAKIRSIALKLDKTIQRSQKPNTVKLDFPNCYFNFSRQTQNLPTRNVEEFFMIQWQIIS